MNASINLKAKERKKQTNKNMKMSKIHSHCSMFTVITERKHKAATIISSNIQHIKILPAYEAKSK